MDHLDLKVWRELAEAFECPLEEVCRMGKEERGHLLEVMGLPKPEFKESTSRRVATKRREEVEEDGTSFKKAKLDNTAEENGGNQSSSIDDENENNPEDKTIKVNTVETSFKDIELPGTIPSLKSSRLPDPHVEEQNKEPAGQQVEQEMKKLKTLLREIGVDKMEIKTSDYQHKGKVVVEVSCRFVCLFVCLLTYLPQTRQEHLRVCQTVQTNPGRGPGHGLQTPDGQHQEEGLPSPGQWIILSFLNHDLWCH